MIHKRLYYFFQSNGLFYDKQFGFRKEHNTIDAITTFTNDIIKSVEAKHSALAVYCDLSKAFDTINHDILLQKLYFYGVRGISLDWFKSYLTGRKQYVQYNSQSSEVRQITCGVPQGSVLGPLLFIIYTNDLPTCLSHSTAILFADDTTLYTSSHDINDLFSKANEDLNYLTDWFRANRLSLNVAKTNYMIFGNGDTSNANYNLKLANSTLSKTSCAKFLGVHIDDKLKWNEHISAVKAKISRSFFAINRAKSVLNTKHLSNLYYSMVYTHIIYGLSLWGAASKVHLYPLDIMHKKIIRVVGGAKYNSHTAPILHKLSMLSLEDIYRKQTCMYMYKFIRGLLPSPLSGAFKLGQDVHPV